MFTGWKWMSHSSLSFTVLGFPITESPDNIQVRAGKLCFLVKNKIYTLFSCAVLPETVPTVEDLYLCIIMKLYSYFTFLNSNYTFFKEKFQSVSDRYILLYHFTSRIIKKKKKNPSRTNFILSLLHYCNVAILLWSFIVSAQNVIIHAAIALFSVQSPVFGSLSDVHMGRISGSIRHFNRSQQHCARVYSSRYVRSWPNVQFLSKVYDPKKVHWLEALTYVFSQGGGPPVRTQ